MIGGVEIPRVIIAGLIGALSMALASYLFSSMNIPMVDFGRLIATKILRYHSHRTRLGLFLHLANGVILALVYAIFLWPFIPGEYWLRGLTYGVFLWLAMMVVVLPAIGDGFFGWKVSRSMIPSALVVHLLYGLVLGFTVHP
jgi:hypothetical protein